MPGVFEYKGVKIERIVHAAFRIEGAGKVVYIDPFQIPSSRRDGDIVICTHDHFDHCSPDDIRKVAKADAVVVAPPNCAGKVRALGLEYVKLEAGRGVEVKGVKVGAVPAYNVDKRYHPKAYGGIGVIVELAGLRIYHAGDTDLIPEMAQLGEVDVALLPVSGTYVMTAEEAARAAEVIKPKIAIPMHYGTIVGSEKDADRFKRLLEGKVEVVVV